MRNYKYLLLVSTCLLFNNNSHASELSLTLNHSHMPLGIFTSDTHTPVELKPIHNFNSGIKLAAVCAVGSGGCDGMGFNTGDNNMNLDNNVQCKDEGFGTSCGSGYVPDYTQKCLFNDSFFKCRTCSHTCSSGSLTSCNSEQIQTGSNKNDCTETCYTCRAKTCEEGGYASSITSCQKATSVSFAGKTCYKNIASKTCSDAGYVTACSSNQVGTSTAYCGSTCYSGCRTPPCSEGGHLANVPTNQICTSVTYYGQNCYKSCYTPTCSQGGYVNACPANQIGTSVNYYGQNCYSGCYQPTCSQGGFEASIPSSKTCTTTSYYGRTCYKDCKNASCSAGGYVDSCSRTQVGTPVDYNGKTCYKDCQSAICEVGSMLYADETCSIFKIPGRTPIGVVFSLISNGLAVTLDRPSLYPWGDSETDVPMIRNCAECEPSGGLNTRNLVLFGEANFISYPAAEACYNYKVDNIRKGFVSLPSIQELKLLYQNKTKVNNILRVLNKSELANGVLWSSNEQDKGYAWALDLKGGGSIKEGKYNSHYALPIINFEY